MIIGGWGPAFDEKRDVGNEHFYYLLSGNEHFYYPALMVLHGIIGMVMERMLALQVLLFVFMPEYGTFVVICIYLIDQYIIH